MGNNVGAIVARKANAMAAEIRGASQTAVRNASLVLKDSALREIRGVVGTDMRLSGVGRNGAKVGVGFNIKGTQNPTSIIQARGPLHFVENDTKAGPRTTRRGRKRQYTFNHPGTKGRQPFGRGIEKGSDKAFDILRRAHIDAVTRGFRA